MQLEQQPWDYLTPEEQAEARKLAREFSSANPRTLPTYSQMKRYSEAAKNMKHNTLIAFGRVVLSECKIIQRYRGIGR